MKDSVRRVASRDKPLQPDAPRGYPRRVPDLFAAGLDTVRLPDRWPAEFRVPRVESGPRGVNARCYSDARAAAGGVALLEAARHQPLRTETCAR